jgi:hypothetical protein
MTLIYQLAHYRPIPETEYEEYEIVIGVYSTYENAEAAIQRLKDKPGYCRFPNGFRIGTWMLDDDSGDEGFATWQEALDALPD